MNAAQTDARPRLSGVQTLRALAALLVLFSHLRFYEWKTSATPLLPAGLDGAGGAGVDLFFVISGFVMVYVTRGAFGRAATAGVFLYNRAARIYPPVWLFAALALIGVHVAGTAGFWLDRTSTLSAFLLWPMAQPPLHGVTWTLIHEMYFYLMFAMFLLGPARLLPVWLALWGVTVVLGNLAGLGALGPRAALALHPMTLEFIAGAAAGLLVCSGRRRFAPAALALGAALYAAACFGMARAALDGGDLAWTRTLLCTPGAFLLVYGVACLEADHGWRAPRAAVMLGDWSYALYLSHPLVLSALAMVWARAELPGTPLDNVLWIAGAGCAAIAFSALTYRLFETPLLRLAAKGRARVFAATVLPPRETIAARIW